MKEEPFVTEFIKLCDKHDVAQAVLLFRDNTILCIRTTGQTTADQAGAKFLGKFRAALRGIMENV